MKFQGILSDKPAALTAIFFLKKAHRLSLLTQYSHSSYNTVYQSFIASSVQMFMLI